jgi:short-chain fatty acids transporter
MTPKQGEDPGAEPAPAPTGTPEPDEPPPADALEKIERSSVVVWMLGFPLLSALVLQISRKGISQLDIDTLNLALWVLALLLHGKPHRFLAACAEGIRSCTGIVLQFPLYAGIMAVMAASGLSARLTTLVGAAGPDALAPLTFLSAGLLNLLVPSGGGQWAVQGPIIMEAALETGVEPGEVLMAMAYGDQWTNMLQPFWALPLLAVTGVRARDIIGYTVLWMAAGGLWMGAALLVFV